MKFVNNEISDFLSHGEFERFHRPAPSTTIRCDLATVNGIVDQYQTLARCKTTRKQSAKTYDNYKSFLQENNLEHSADSTNLYLGSLVQRDYAPNSIKLKLSQLKFSLELKGIPDYSLAPKVKLFLKGLGNINKDLTPAYTKQPVTLQLVQRFIEVMPVCTKNKFKELMLSAVFAVAFFSLFQMGEITFCKGKALIKWEEMVIGPDYVTFWVHNSKIAAFRQGPEKVEIVSTGQTLCPVRLFKNYLKDSYPKSGRVFIFPDGEPLTYQQVTLCMHQILKYLGVTSRKIGTHSLRVGGATHLLHLGASILLSSKRVDGPPGLTKGTSNLMSPMLKI